MLDRILSQFRRTGVRGNTAAGDRHAAHGATHARVRGDVEVRGRWGMGCLRPLVIVLPDRLAWECERLGLPLPSRFTRGLVTAKELPRYEARLGLAECARLFAGGGLKWAAAWDNLVVNTGLNQLLDSTIGAGTQATTWYVGLVNGATPTFAAGDTMSSHSGWTENQAYDESVRQTWTKNGAASGGSISNSSSAATFTISTDSQTIGGAFLASNSTKGGTTGVLYAAGDLDNDKSADDGDSLAISATFTTAAA